MNAWQNIIVAPDDPEIKKIDDLEKTLGPLSADIQQIRNLITRFEVCHFKYQQHLSHIKEAIKNLKTEIDPEKIGSNHLKNGPKACANDKTGRSQLGQKYVSDLKGWLEGKTDTKVAKLLGEREWEKEYLVKLLIARLLYDWKTYEELEGITSVSPDQAEKEKDLKLQVCGMDICHYSFPKNLDQLLQGIGQLKLKKGIEGCGSYKSEIKSILEKEFLSLNQNLKSLGQDQESRIRAWLTACLAKTLKQDVGLKKPVFLT